MTLKRMTEYESIGGQAHAVPTGDPDVAMMRLAAYEDTDLSPETCAEYKKFEDELVRSGTSFQHVLDLLEAEKEGRLTIRKRQVGECCGQCHHFLREPQRASGVCEVRKYRHYPRAGQPLYCCQSKKACLDFEERGDRPIRYQGGLQ